MTGYISPNSIIDANVEIGSNVWIWHFSHVRDGTILSKNVSIGEHCYIGPNTLIGQGSKIQNGVQLHDKTVLEEGVFIGPGVIITNDKRPRAVDSNGRRLEVFEWSKASCFIGSGASIGAGSIIISPIRIGNWAMIGAGSTVTKDVPSHALVVGNPARFVSWVGFRGEKLVKRDEIWVSEDTGDCFSAYEFGLELNG